jgi:hypothetical protein
MKVDGTTTLNNVVVVSRDTTCFAHYYNKTRARTHGHTSKKLKNFIIEKVESFRGEMCGQVGKMTWTHSAVLQQSAEINNNEVCNRK